MKINLFKRFSIATVWLWLGLFAVIPLTLVLVISFLTRSDNQLYTLPFHFSNYIQLFDQSNVFFTILLRSFKLAFETTVICLFLAYPAALIIAQTKSKFKNLMLILIIIPFWTSGLLRIYGILAVIKVHGLLNKLLLWIGVIHTPFQIAYTTTAVLIGLSYNLLPFMLLPLYSNMEKLDPKLLEAARDLGASRFKILKDVLIPQTMSGIVAGTLLVFLPAMTLFYIPDLLGGAKSLLLGNLIQQQFLDLNDWPAGAATSIVLTIIMSALLILYQRSLPDNKRKEP